MKREDIEQLWEVYRWNPFRHLIDVNRYFIERVMHGLVRERGHSAIRLSFEPLISQLPPEGISVTRLAQSLGMSKQYCFALLNEIEEAGYLRRHQDPRDSRGKLVKITPAGQQLILDAMQVASQLETEIGELIGARRFQRLAALSARLYRAFDLPLIQMTAHTLELNPTLSPTLMYLSRLSDHVHKQLMRFIIARGHPGLKLSHAQVLNNMSLRGARISDLAAFNEVTKQGIGRVADNLEELGYIYRAVDSRDARSRILQFTERGFELIRDTVDSIRDLEGQCQSGIGRDAFKEMKTLFADLHAKLQLGEVATPPESMPVSAQPPESRGESLLPPLGIGELLLYAAFVLESRRGDSKGARYQWLNVSNRDNTQRHSVTFGERGLKELASVAVIPEKIEQLLQKKLGSRQSTALHEQLNRLAHCILETLPEGDG